ncbi:hypothetical protein SAMN04487820_1033 [Actinopolyspora mzabensis]|uniref:DUF7144 domain-containing protein n=1 Tax=Actinopolyspora mzabensis TaxID=995066 RepID=A0A1G8XQ24_ACTMZ|nr:hypothetical protein [Actinopolyspora mzabensis]SDJ92628.1 hypothetical protein SAMN04487820_1033 [Actinopolyspora mzabensis]
MSTPQTGPQSTPGAGEGTERRAPEERGSWAMTAAQPTSGMSGWLAFGGWMLALVGVFNVIAGLTALLQPGYYVAANGELLVFGFGAWGWIWLAFGVLQVAAGAGCLAGQMWARMTGIALAGLAAIAHLAFLAAFPFWELVSIGLCVLVIYSLVVPPRNAVG